MVDSDLGYALRRIRLISGLVLFTYVASHFVNHALGLISLDALDRGSVWFTYVWRAGLPTVLLYGALLAHFLLALWSIYRRRRLARMRAGEAVQLIAGLLIVPMLAQHVIATRLAHDLYDVFDSYARVLVAIWHFDPIAGLWQSAALLVAWTHGCIGLHYWLRLKPYYPRALPYLYALAILVPVMALLGFAQAGRAIDALAADREWLRLAQIQFNNPTGEAAIALGRIADLADGVFVAALALTLGARGVRALAERRRGRVRLTYPGGRVIEIAPGLTVLEASQLHAIAHAAVCGGRGRCSTCRVRVSRGLETLPPPSTQEQAVLSRVGAPPGVRLACQIRPTRDLVVAPLLAPNATPRDAHRQPEHLRGQESEIAILFADIRGFTRLAEAKLPYDVVFVLNRYFAAMGEAIEGAGGRVDKFIGDGVMALFGIEQGAAQGSRQALAAARAMSRALEALNQTLAHDLTEPLRIGIGIHVGPAIVGEMGYGHVRSLTAIGDVVNTASRIEALTKEFGVELVASDSLVERAGLDLSAHEWRETAIRGRAGMVGVRVIARASELPE